MDNSGNILDHFKEWEISRSEIDLTDNRIGEGSYGCVFHAQMKSDHPTDRWKKGARAAVKILERNLSEFKLARELIIPCSLQIPGILPFFGFVKEDAEHPPMLVTKFMPDGTMGDIVQHRRKGRRMVGWKDEKFAILLYRVAKVMEFVHMHGFIHRDIKPENILLGQCKVPVIGDFGSARPMAMESVSDGLTRAAGTPLFMAPELSDGEWYGKKVDVYAFGVTAYLYWACDTDKIVHDDEAHSPLSTVAALLEKVRAGVRYTNPGIPAVYWDLITRCWAQDPADRPSFTQICAEMEARCDDFSLTKVAAEKKRFKEAIKNIKSEISGTVDSSFTNVLEILRDRESSAAASAVVSHSATDTFPSPDQEISSRRPNTLEHM